jgi:surface polysaccharide O-acyltransferase-like enzyme
VGVVLIHAHGFAVKMSGGALGGQEMPRGAEFAQELITQVWAQIAVPLFFLVSGYLFFRDYAPSRLYLQTKLRKKIRTLFVPYMIWNIVVLLMLYSAQTIPAFAGYISGENKPVAQYGVYDYFNAFIGIDDRPVCAQFWYIRDLMLMILFSPIIWVLLKRLCWIGLALLAGAWFFGLEFRVINFSYTALMFFYLGGLMMVKQWPLNQSDRFGLLITVGYLVLSVIEAWSRARGKTFNLQAHNTILLTGMAAVWYITGRLVVNNQARQLLGYLAGLSFFVYAAHAPLVIVVKKLLYKLTEPTGSIEIIIMYLSAPVLTILITLGAGIVLRRILPGVFKVVTGSR